ncbi:MULTISPECIES: universal stress protein [Neisseria]|uniref:Universal stress family protein n=1 Tax=Neisseria musculi TaxID=1815583 RepID=A0A7H1MDU3_9NEIS|nr:MULTISPECIES: universal stress protein [Neisseria]MBF0804656.1 universal stress protein [Neisseria sp. 19428wB4_WF04]QNT59808.1 universal stress family protein [Neisseria musculi]TFU40324.1 universal stress protein [Neisseria sp. WF04]
MYQRILVPVDDSTAALYALKEACKLAKQLDAAILAVHVVDVAQFDWGSPAFSDTTAVRKAVEAAGIQVLEKNRTVLEAAGVRHESLIMESAGDKTADLLVAQAAEENCDLIVMGTHGFSGLMHLLMGSVAEGVVRKSHVPVLLVRRKDD